MKCFFFLFILLMPLKAQDSTFKRPDPLVATELKGQIRIDGILDTDEWSSARANSDFFQREPNEGAPATQKTEVYIKFDKEALYIGAFLHDSAPDSIVQKLTRKDVFAPSDRFMVFVDPLHDRRTGYYFAINAAGSVQDGTLLNDDWDDSSWDAVWEGKSSIVPGGWSVEMKIPFSRLRFNKGQDIVWGINFKRELSRRNESSYLVFRPLNGSGFTSRFPDLLGLKDIEGGKNFEIVPYITTKAEYIPASPGDPFNDGSRYTPDFGADIKWNLSSGLTMNASINPDFGQVEIDPAVINLSDAESFFNEKRPFFIEGDSYYSFGYGGSNNFWGFNFGPPEFFYSRRIGRSPSGSVPSTDYYDVPVGTKILAATKLSGEMGNGWKLGTLHSLTGREFAELQTNGIHSEAEIEPLAYYGLARVKKEFDGGTGSIGIISTYVNRAFKDGRLQSQMNKSSLAFGLDGWFYLDNQQEWVFTGWTGVSRIGGSSKRLIDVQKNYVRYKQRPDVSHLGIDSSATSLSGFSGRYIINKQKGNVMVNAQLAFVDKDFDVSDLGFMFRGDAINKHIVGGYRWTEPGDIIRRANVNFAYFSNHDFGWIKFAEGFFHSGNLTFTNYLGMNWNAAYNPTTYNKTRTRGGPLTVNSPGYQLNSFFWTDSRKDFVTEFGGGFYGTNDNASRFISVWLQWSPASNLQFSVNPEIEWYKDRYMYVTTSADPLAVNTYGNRYVFADINQKTFSMGTRINWTFSPTMSLQAYIQPLVSAANYTNYKELKYSGTSNFLTYGSEGSTFDNTSKTADPDGNGPAPSINVGNNDFNYISFRGNAVLRWEYIPGSVFYLVWTQTRNDYNEIPDFRLNNSVSRMFNDRPDNIFMIKFTYWLDA